MNHDKFEEYRVKRYRDQIAWYGSRAKINKRFFCWFQGLLIFLSVCTPVVITKRDFFGDTTTIVCSLAVAALASFLKVFRFQEQWMNYRTTCETLKKEEHYYEASVGPYAHSANKESLFVERVETLISQENTIWIKGEKKNEGLSAN